MEGVLTRVTTVPERNYLPTPPEVARFGPQAPGKADFQSAHCGRHRAGNYAWTVHHRSFPL